MKRFALDSPCCYLNRYLKWLELNRRELEQARDSNRPFERVKSLPMTANNMDEFVAARVSSFLQRIKNGSRVNVRSLTPKQDPAKTSATMHGLVADHYRCRTSEFLATVAIDLVASSSFETETQVSANAAV